MALRPRSALGGGHGCRLKGRGHRAGSELLRRARGPVWRDYGWEGFRSRGRGLSYPGPVPGGRVEPLPAPWPRLFQSDVKEQPKMPDNDENESETAASATEGDGRTGEEQAGKNREEDPPA